MRGGWIHALPARITIAPWPSSSVLIQPLYICSRQFAVVRRRAFCVGRTTIYYSTVFRQVRRVPPILLRQRCDGRNKRGVGNGFWLGTDARHGFAHASFDRGFPTSGGAIPDIRSALHRISGAGGAERRQNVGLGLSDSWLGEGATNVTRACSRCKPRKGTRARQRADQRGTGRPRPDRGGEGKPGCSGFAAHHRKTDRTVRATQGCRPPADRKGNREPFEAGAFSHTAPVRG